ncbi:branched-chain amino acid ABC transporter permease [Microvirga antarctica]|uniref:branched-chain amino acid ABC transporter permease n=1 Tax=Microvirga antarctica TaxID=2819233 RepID=UPI001B3054A5|nr:branched-chain amino acid ABC transporter permease [Microvirga antarctica]
MFFQLATSGIATGCAYALIALGFVMIWNTASVVNFAQGEFVVIAMFVALTCHVTLGWPLWMVLPLAVLLPAIVGYATERVVIRPVIGAAEMTIVTVTIGLQIVLSDAAKIIYGGQPYSFPPLIAGKPLSLAGIVVPRQSLVVIASMIVLAIGLHFLSQKTSFGKRLRAVSQDRETAKLMGIDVNRTIAQGFALSAAIAGFAGVLLAPIIYVSAGLGLPLLIKSFIAAIIGGFGSYIGALIGGLLIGVLDNLVGFYISSHYREVFTFLALILVLLFRPQGLFPHHR